MSKNKHLTDADRLQIEILLKTTPSSQKNRGAVTGLAGANPR